MNEVLFEYPLFFLFFLFAVTCVDIDETNERTMITLAAFSARLGCEGAHVIRWMGWPGRIFYRFRPARRDKCTRESNAFGLGGARGRKEEVMYYYYRWMDRWGKRAEGRLLGYDGWCIYQELGELKCDGYTNDSPEIL